MEKELTIQQVSEITQLSVHTLRYYERIGLLDPVCRRANGYRRYSPSDIAWIEFLNRLRATGMSIRKMQVFAGLRRQGAATVRERRVLLEEHQSEVEKRVKELTENLRSIEAKVVHYKEMEREQ